MSKSNDLTDSPEDKKHLEPERVNIDLPDVQDIPGQEHIHIPKLGEVADTTISSDDEEGKGLLGDNANVSAEEKELLQDTSESMSTEDDINLKHARVDDKDLDGEPLNETADVSGKDLDVPGEEDDDSNEEIGEEDEENNEYSLGGDNYDN